jgi:hypothetical protein
MYSVSRTNVSRLSQDVGPHKRGDPIVPPEVCQDPFGVDETSVVCAYNPFGWSGGERHFFSHVRTLGRTVSRTDHRVPDKDVRGTPPDKIRQSIQA